MMTKHFVLSVSASAEEMIQGVPGKCCDGVIVQSAA